MLKPIGIFSVQKPNVEAKAHESNLATSPKQESPEPRMEGEGFDTKSSISKGIHTGY